MNRREHRCLVFAHRGASAEAFENTERAFDKALDYAIDGIETDVQMTSDGVSVLWHDWFLDKAGLSGKRVGDLNFEQVRSLELSHASTSSADTESVFTLNAFVRSYHRESQLLLEVKNDESHHDTEHHQASIRACCDIVERHTASARGSTVYISSFHMESLIYAKRYADHRAFILNTEAVECAADVRRILNEFPFLSGLCLPIDALNEPMAETLRQYSKTVATYTCNSDEEMTKAMRLEVDILITDDVPKALALQSSD